MLGGSFFIFLDFFCIFVVSKNQPYTPLVDKILSFEVGCANIDYGFAFGNTQKILFIKAGAQGSMYGYRDKYLNIALNAKAKYGVTVVCSSNPQCDINQTTHALQVLENAIETFNQAEIYFMGFSKGASQGCIEWTIKIHARIYGKAKENHPCFYSQFRCGIFDVRCRGR